MEAPCKHVQFSRNEFSPKTCFLATYLERYLIKWFVWTIRTILVFGKNWNLINEFQSKFNLNYVFSFFKRKKKNIKSFLLDQNFVSGIGNIYASEILFLTKINPNKQVNLLKKKDCRKIIINLTIILLSCYFYNIPKHDVDYKFFSNLQKK